MSLRSVLAKEKFDPIFDGSPVFCQFSSLGSLDAKWLLQELQAGTLSAGLTDPRGKYLCQQMKPPKNAIQGHEEDFAIRFKLSPLFISDKLTILI